ncbi:MAG: flagellar filament capping protein FliD [Gallionella sp.]|nr:flagellar filament capping protein FliD [Gallionella sp.]MDP1939992.1 flagellar filament capping protein FliD [Gallionella sp.]
MATTGVSSSVTSGLDVNALVSQLMTVEQQPLAKLDKQEASYQAKLSAFGSIKGAVASFQSTMRTLSNASSFRTVTATASDTSVLSATALTSALPGSYSVEVSSLAQSQKLVAAGQSSVGTAIGSGATTTLSFDFGTITGTLTNGKYEAGATFSTAGGGVKTVTIDSSNNSLQGMRDAINAAGIGVTASIINDGSATPYRLVLSSNNMGAANSLKISATGDATVSALLANDPTAGALGQNLSESVSALNAVLKVNGITVSKASNSVSDVISGVTLNLAKLTTTPVTLTVAQDTAATAKAVNSFVASYNELSKTLKDLSSYDAATKKGATLQGDATIRNLQAKLRDMLNTTGTGALTSLSQIGVTFQRDGSLAVDSSKLNSAMQSNFNDIAGLFAATGKTSDSLVTYNASGINTKPGSYALTVTQLATQGNETGTAAPNLTIDATNDTLVMNINGINTTITLASKTYASALELASELQSKLNSATALSAAGVSVSASLDAGKISVSSNSYGATSSVVATSGNGLSNIFGTAISTTGVDVAGTINGVSASGSGQTLIAADSEAQGLSVLINGGALGSRGTVSYTKGYAYTLNNFATSVLASDGSLSSSTDEINTSIKSLAARRTALQHRLVGIEARYRAQFTALDQMLSSMNTTSTFLTQQLAGMSNSNA